MSKNHVGNSLRPFRKPLCSSSGTWLLLAAGSPPTKASRRAASARRSLGSPHLPACTMSHGITQQRSLIASSWLAVTSGLQQSEKVSRSMTVPPTPKIADPPFTLISTPSDPLPFSLLSSSNYLVSTSLSRSHSWCNAQRFPM